MCEKRIFQLGGPDYRLTSHLEEEPVLRGGRQSQRHKSRPEARRGWRGRLSRNNSVADADSANASHRTSPTPPAPTGPSLISILEDGLGSKYFLDYASCEQQEHNLRFWSSVRSFRKVRWWEGRVVGAGVRMRSSVRMLFFYSHSFYSVTQGPGDTPPGHAQQFDVSCRHRPQHCAEWEAVEGAVECGRLIFRPFVCLCLSNLSLCVSLSPLPPPFPGPHTHKLIPYPD